MLVIIILLDVHHHHHPYHYLNLHLHLHIHIHIHNHIHIMIILVLLLFVVLIIILGYPLPSSRGAVGGHIIHCSFLLYSVYFKKDAFLLGGRHPLPSFREAGFGHPLLRF